MSSILNSGFFFSKRAGEEEGSSDEEEPAESQDAFADIEKLANLFPFTGKGHPNVNGLALIEMFLPSFERASQLCDSYIKHGSYFFRPIKSDDLLAVLFPSIYKRITARSQNSSQDMDPNRDEVVHNTPHALATLCFIFALGCLLDLTLPPYNSEAERYYDLGRAALSLKPVYDSPNMDSVQAMGLMATYHSMAGKKYSRDSAVCGLCCKQKDTGSPLIISVVRHELCCEARSECTCYYLGFFLLRYAIFFCRSASVSINYLSFLSNFRLISLSRQR